MPPREQTHKLMPGLVSHHWFLAWLCLAGCLAVGGCGGESPRYEVSGSVTFDGQPVENGSISFVPTEPEAPPEAAPIEQGRYTLHSSPGHKRVKIRASRPLPADRQDPNSEMGQFYEDYIPARYNSDTKLTAEVTAAGPNTFSFDLQGE